MIEKSRERNLPTPEPGGDGGKAVPKDGPRSVAGRFKREAGGGALVGRGCVPSSMEIRVDDSTGPEVRSLLEEHLGAFERFRRPRACMRWESECEA